MTRPTDTITFAVDFNDVTPEGRLLASMRFAYGAVRIPQPDEHVVAHDSEGNWCDGTVYSYQGLTVTITLDRDTWRQTPVTTLSNPFEGAVGHLDQETKGVDPELVPELVG